MSLINLTSAQLRQAADLKERIASLNDELTAILGGSATPAPATAPAKKGGMSAAGRARIAAAAKLRWAKINAAKAKPTAVVKAVAQPVVAKKRSMSAAAKAKVAAAQKLRWAKIHAAKAKSAPAAKPAAKAVVKAVKPAKKKGKISPEGMANIIAATKARWAKIRAAKAAKKK